MEQFVYTSPLGNSITIDYRGDYLIDSYDGLTASDIEPITVKGYNQNGYTLSGVSYGVRHINLNFLLRASNIEGIYQKRRELAKIFNPLLGEGTLTYTNNHISKSIKCLPTVVPTPVDRMGLMIMMNIELTAHNPFWFDNAESAVMLNGFVGGLTFPIKFNDTVRFATRGASASIQVEGDVPSPIRAEFSGSAGKPRLLLQNTGEFIEVNTSLSAGETMVITTDYGNKNVVLNKADGTKESAYHLINLESSFFSLPTGKNTISFSASSGSPEVCLYWRNWYVGV